MKKRLLLAITVYNGRPFVPQCLESAKRLSQTNVDIDVLVLDDQSPDREFSADLEKLCGEIGAQYYCTPRNLGIPRNVNLGLLASIRGDYDYVVISNSDVIYAEHVMDQLATVAETDESIGTVTAWSTNVSAYSLPNVDPDRFLSAQGVVDWLGASLSGLYGDTAIDIPAGISFSMLVPVRLLGQIGLMDPVYGRGYCEELDFCLRARSLGLRNVLAPGSFVYHSGGGSNRDAGLLSPGQTTVPANERIIDHRYPMFREQVGSFFGSGILDDARKNATERIVQDAARQFGYFVRATWLPGRPAPDEYLTVELCPDRDQLVATAKFRGFEHALEIDATDPLASIVAALGGAQPREATVLDRSKFGLALAHAWDSPISPEYPERV